MQSEEEAQYALKQMLQRKQEKERLQHLEDKLNSIVSQLIQTQKDIEENDYQYELKMKELDQKRIDQMREIEELRKKQQEDLETTVELYADLMAQAQKFHQMQEVFISQQKQDRDMLKSFQKTQVSKTSIIDVSDQYVTKQNPFLLLTKTQGLLDSQNDSYFQKKLQDFDTILDQASEQFNSIEILVTLISYKPDIPTVEQFQDRVYSGHSQQIPTVMQFLIDFYDFPTFTTKRIIFEEFATIQELREAIALEKDLKLAYEEFFENTSMAKKVVFKFELELNDHTFYYMLFKSAQFRMTDPTTGENFGYFQLPFNQLFDDFSQPQVNRLLECQVLSYDWKTTCGCFLISMTRIGKQVSVPTETNFLKNSHAQDFGKTYKSKFVRTSQNFFFQEDGDRISQRISLMKSQEQFMGKKMKIVSEAPKSVFEFKKTAIINQQLADVPKQARQKLRIHEVKKDYINHLSIRDEYGRQEAIRFLKNWRKKDMLRSVLPSQLKSTAIDVELKRGQKAVQQLQFMLDYDACVEVEITNPICFLPAGEELHQNYESFKIENGERVQFDEKGKIIFPKKKLLTIILLFYSKQEIVEEEVGIYLKVNRISIGGQLYRVVPAAQVIDLTLQFYERPNYQLRLQLPQIYSFCEHEYRFKPVILSDQDQCTFTVDDQQYLMMSFRTPEVSDSKTFHIFFYRDSFLQVLLLTLKVIIYAIPTLEFSVNQGKAQQFELELTSDLNRIVLVHSLNKQKAWLEVPYSIPFSMVAKKLTKIPIKVFQMTNATSKVMLTVVDQSTNEIIYSWLLLISTTVPIITNVLKINCNFRKAHQLNLNYRNTTDLNLNLQVTSSDYLIKVLQSNYKMLPNHDKTIHLLVQKGQEYANQELKMIEAYREIKLFLYDQAHAHFECILFQVQFTD